MTADIVFHDEFHVKINVAEKPTDEGILMDQETTISDSALIGRYITFCLKSPNVNVSDDSIPSRSQAVRTNTFSLMMEIHRDKIYLPRRDEFPTTGKNKVKNSIIDWMEKNEMFFFKQSASSSGKKLVQVIQDTFWYIDGRNHTLANQGDGVPIIFEQYLGFKKPEISAITESENMIIFPPLN